MGIESAAAMLQTKGRACSWLEEMLEVKKVVSGVLVVGSFR